MRSVRARRRHRWLFGLSSATRRRHSRERGLLSFAADEERQHMPPVSGAAALFPLGGMGSQVEARAPKADGRRDGGQELLQGRTCDARLSADERVDVAADEVVAQVEVARAEAQATRKEGRACSIPMPRASCIVRERRAALDLALLVQGAASGPEADRQVQGSCPMPRIPPERGGGRYPVARIGILWPEIRILRRAGDEHALEVSSRMSWSPRRGRRRRPELLRAPAALGAVDCYVANPLFRSALIPGNAGESEQGVALLWHA